MRITTSWESMSPPELEPTRCPEEPTSAHDFFGARHSLWAPCKSFGVPWMPWQSFWLRNLHFCSPSFTSSMHISLEIGFGSGFLLLTTAGKSASDTTAVPDDSSLAPLASPGAAFGSCRLLSPFGPTNFTAALFGRPRAAAGAALSALSFGLPFGLASLFESFAGMSLAFFGFLGVNVLLRNATTTSADLLRKVAGSVYRMAPWRLELSEFSTSARKSASSPPATLLCSSCHHVFFLLTPRLLPLPCFSWASDASASAPSLLASFVDFLLEVPLLSCTFRLLISHALCSSSRSFDRLACFLPWRSSNRRL
mmetsp:Transcript_46493/g.132566  ORF Transcript_46493/g.132566 Transcript_46493/m.132566 type:complete len:310 (+) Transcript_46493:877-1806(+)